MNAPVPTCAVCGEGLIQKHRPRLIAVGLLLLLVPGVAWFKPVLLLPGILSASIGLYLLTWATRGRGRWCRHCKHFPTAA